VEVIMYRVFLHGGLAASLFLVAASGCSATSGSALPAAARGLSSAALQASPEAYQGQRVTLGGTIVAMHARPHGTDIEVIGRPLDGEGRPERGDRTTGRFIVRSTEALDATTYAPGRSITAAGQVAPMQSWWDDDGSSERYPVLTYAQILLWPPDTTTGGVYVGQRSWVWPYTFWWGPAPYVPLVTIW
jgi:outer membrane lipoprotein